MASSYPIESHAALNYHVTKSMDIGIKKTAAKLGFASSSELIQDVFEKEWTKISNPFINMSSKERILHHVQKL